MSFFSNVAPFLSFNNWQHDMGRVLTIVVDGLAGLDHLGRGVRILPCVQIAVEKRKVTAGNFDSYSMALFEDDGGRAEIDFVFVDLARLNQRRIFYGFSES